MHINVTNVEPATEEIHAVLMTSVSLNMNTERKRRHPTQLFTILALLHLDVHLMKMFDYFEKNYM